MTVDNYSLNLKAPDFPKSQRTAVFHHPVGKTGAMVSSISKTQEHRQFSSVAEKINTPKVIFKRRIKIIISYIFLCGPPEMTTYVFGIVYEVV